MMPMTSDCGRRKALQVGQGHTLNLLVRWMRKILCNSATIANCGAIFVLNGAGTFGRISRAARWSLLLSGLLLGSQLPAQEAQINQIRQRVQVINSSLQRYQRKDTPLYNDEGMIADTMHRFDEGSALRLVQTAEGSEDSARSIDLYFWDDRLLFAFIDHNDVHGGSEQRRYYFDGDTLIRALLSSGGETTPMDAVRAAEESRALQVAARSFAQPRGALSGRTQLQDVSGGRAQPRPSKAEPSRPSSLERLFSVGLPYLLGLLTGVVGMGMRRTKVHVEADLAPQPQHVITKDPV